MVSTTASRLGASLGVNGANGFADENAALLLKIFSGEVLSIFDKKQIARDMVRSRRISGAKEAQFPIIGNAAAGYHEPGKDISDPATGLMQEIQHAEKIIKIDYPLVAPVFVSEFDEAINHYETRSEYAHQLGQALANKWDKLLLRVMSKCGDATATVSGSYAGVEIDANDASYTVAEFIDDVFQAKQTFDERDVPMEDRFLIVPPVWEVALIKSDSKLLDRDFSPSNGSYARATIGRMAGMTVVTSNHVPFDATAPGAEAGQKNSSYAGAEALKVQALAVTPEAVGQVSLWDMEVQSQYSALHQGTFLMARMACGADILKPECCIPIINTNAAAVQGPTA